MCSRSKVKRQGSKGGSGDVRTSLVAHTEETINQGEREGSGTDDNACRDSAPQGVCSSEFPDSENRRSDGNEEADRGDPKRKRHNPAWVEETARFQTSLPFRFGQRMNLHVVRHIVYSRGADRPPRYGYHNVGYVTTDSPSRHGGGPDGGHHSSRASHRTALSAN
jgi:hypothetical protein